MIKSLKKTLLEFNQVIIMEDNMVLIREPKTFHCNLELP